MSNVINKPLCATQFGNVGFGDCYIEIAKMAGAIQVTSGFAIAEANVAGLQAFLKNLITAPIGTRIFPYHNFISIADASEDLNITTTDYGAKYINREGFYDWTYRYLKGGLQLHQEIKKNEGTGKYFLFYDDNGVLYGYTTNGQLQGIPIDIFHVNPWKAPTGADQAGFNLRFIINPKYLNKGNLGYIPTSQLGFNMFDIVGLQDVSLQLINLVSNVATIGAFSKISNVNMHDAYAANLARTAAWVARNNFNNPVTISSVADNVAAGGWDFTFLSGNWLASDKVYVKGVGAAIWAATPILVVGFEAKDELQIEAPAS